MVPRSCLSRCFCSNSAHVPRLSGKPAVPDFRGAVAKLCASDAVTISADTTTAIMSVRQAPSYQQGAPTRQVDDDSDVEEEALANDFREQAGYGGDDGYGLEQVDSYGGGGQDLQAQLQAAATPLEYGASTELKIQSYDSYCNLFHFILNSEGPVDIEVPSVRISAIQIA